MFVALNRNDHITLFFCIFNPLSEQASNIKEMVEVVQAALDETQRAQNVAMDAIQLAQNNTKNTMDLLLSVSLENI